MLTAIPAATPITKVSTDFIDIGLSSARKETLYFLPRSYRSQLSPLASVLGGKEHEAHEDNYVINFIFFVCFVIIYFYLEQHYRTFTPARQFGSRQPGRVGTPYVPTHKLTLHILRFQ